MSLGSDDAADRAGGRDGRRDEQDGARVPRGEAREIHFAIVMARAVRQAVLALSDDLIAGGDAGSSPRPARASCSAERDRVLVRLVVADPATNTKVSSPSCTTAAAGIDEHVLAFLGHDLDFDRRARGSAVGFANVRRTSPVALPVSTCAGSADHHRGLALAATGSDDLRGVARSGCACRSATGTAATTCRWLGSITRSTGSDAAASTMSPALCQRLATTPAKRARTTARSASSPAASRGALRLREVGFGIELLAPGASSTCRAAPPRPASTSPRQARDRRPWPGRAARSAWLDGRFLGGDLGGQRRNVEAHQHVARGDRVAFGLGQFGDARGFGRRDRPSPLPAPARHGAAHVDRRLERVELCGFHRDRHGRRGFGLLERRLAARGGRQDRAGQPITSCQQIGSSTGHRSVCPDYCGIVHLPIPIARSRSASADWKSRAACSPRCRVSRACCSACSSATKLVCPRCSWPAPCARAHARAADFRSGSAAVARARPTPARPPRARRRHPARPARRVRRAAAPVPQSSTMHARLVRREHRHGHGETEAPADREFRLGVPGQRRPGGQVGRLQGLGDRAAELLFDQPSIEHGEFGVALRAPARRPRPRSARRPSSKSSASVSAVSGRLAEQGIELRTGGGDFATRAGDFVVHGRTAPAPFAPLDLRRVAGVEPRLRGIAHAYCQRRADPARAPAAGRRRPTRNTCGALPPARRRSPD